MPCWDPSAHYSALQLAVYFVEEWAGQLREGGWQRGWNDGGTALGWRYVEVDVLQPLKALLEHPRHTIPQWPMFHVFVRGSRFGFAVS